MSKFSDILASIASDGHIVCGMLIFFTGAGIHVFHHIDATFVTFTTTILGFLGGHFYTQAKYPDQTDSTTPTTPTTPQS
jgi:hypothetical protein